MSELRTFRFYGGWRLPKFRSYASDNREMDDGYHNVGATHLGFRGEWWLQKMRGYREGFTRSEGLTHKTTCWIFEWFVLIGPSNWWGSMKKRTGRKETGSIFSERQIRFYIDRLWDIRTINNGIGEMTDIFFWDREHCSNRVSFDRWWQRLTFRHHSTDTRTCSHQKIVFFP